MNYQDFLEQKTHVGVDSGFESDWMPDILYPFQKHLVQWAQQKGRGAIFADCGTGKTAIQLTWGQNIIEKTNKPVLVLTPLSVATQTIKEGDKFGIETINRRNGIVPDDKLVVTNYERLHYFNSSDFAGVVCDECFPPDTPIDVFNIDNSLTSMHIEDVRRGDTLFNANGRDNVEEIYKRKINRAVRVGIGGRTITCSENHPFFTMHGWRCAQDIRPGDSIMATEAAVRMVRGDIPSEIHSNEDAKILREILLSEMENETARGIGEGPQQGRVEKNRGIKKQAAKERESLGVGTDRTNIKIKSYEEPKITSQVLCYASEDEPQAFRAWGKWNGDDIARARNEGLSVRELDFGIYYITGNTSTGFSNMLQSGLRKSRDENSHRGGWAQSQGDNTKSNGRKENEKAEFVRVDSIEILERGHPQLEKYRNESGDIYFYDIKATRHPSFSINGLLVHNSSILKNYDGATRSAINDFMRKTPYRLLCTATAAPNDYIELGTSSEVLGEMGCADMISRFFKKVTKTYTRKDEHRGGVYRFRGHAERHFWRWVCYWARSLRRPSDLGFSDDGFVLPSLNVRTHKVQATRAAEGMLFDMPATNFREEREAVRRTINERCEKASDILNSHNRQGIAWCHLNDESSLLKHLIKGAVEVKGGDTDEQKEEKISAFTNGEARVMVTKPKIAGFGMNWQHCSDQTYFPTHSYEQYYQAIRRSWRYGQENTVNVDIISTDGQSLIFENLKRKTVAAEKMFDMLVSYMRDELKIKTVNHCINKEEIPSWL